MFPVPHTAYNEPAWLAAAAAAAEPATTFGEIRPDDWLPHALTPAARYTDEPLPVPTTAIKDDSSDGEKFQDEELDLDKVVDAPMAITMNPIDNDGSLQSMMNPVQDGMAKQT